MRNRLSREQIKTFLFDHIRRSINTDIKPLLKEKCDEEEIGGYFAVPGLVFTLIEYLGRLRYGYVREDRGSIRAVWWIKKYLGDVNKRYKKTGGLLFDMLRHGPIHTREPKKYLFALNKGFTWEIVKAERNREHMFLPNGRNFVISLDQLVEDLESAIDNFWKDLDASTKLQIKFSNAYWKMRKPQWVPWLLNRRNKNHKRYLRKEFEYIKKELRPW